ncbi:hypothetical protein ACJRO7_000782 [Eucalyptus globulus]|uniref:MGS-like domain-containing protein n=1 Tax=Eucalyptus globulus TaxID=34317 RepID=A0ABD3LPR7_EUCGL
MLGSPVASTSSTAAAAAAASFRSSLLHFSTIHRTRTCPSTSQPEPFPSAPRGKQALISLSDKTDLTFLGKGLQELGSTVVSTGGTASALENAGLSVTKVEQLTCFPEMLDGHVKTLYPHIYGGILARRDQQHHMEALDRHGIDGIENVDIGGPATIRAAAKNHRDVLVVVDSHDYPVLLEFLKSNGDDQQFRRKLSWKAFQRVASYDSAVLEWLWRQTTGEKFPSSLTVPLSLKSSLHYGENPQQKAALSYNHLDADAALNYVSQFSDPTCVVLKHTNPCGVASGGDILEACGLAVKAQLMAKLECSMRLVAPKYSKKGLEVLRGKSKTLRILEAKKNEDGKLSLRQVGGRWLAQDSDNFTPADIQFNAVSGTAPQDSELEDARFAWLCVENIEYTYAPSFNIPGAITQRKASITCSISCISNMGLYFKDTVSLTFKSVKLCQLKKKTNNITRKSF